MKSAPLFFMFVISGCASQSVSPARAPATIGIAVEGGGGVTTEARLATRYSFAAGFEAQNCCGAGVYLARSYSFAKDSDETGVHGARLAGEDVTEIGGAFTVKVLDVLRVRMRGAVSAMPPHDQDLSRTGVAGGVGVLLRFPQDPVKLGACAPHVDLVTEYTQWALGRQPTSAGQDGKSLSAGALTLSLRISADYGVDFQ